MANSLLRALTSGQPPGAQELHGLQASECTVSEHALRETTFSTESVPKCHVQLKFGHMETNASIFKLLARMGSQMWRA